MPRTLPNPGTEIPIKVKQLPEDKLTIREIYYLNGQQELIPAFIINWNRKNLNEWLQLYLDGISGVLLAEYNQIQSCDFEHMTFESKSLFQVHKQEEPFCQLVIIVFFNAN